MVKPALLAIPVERVREPNKGVVDLQLAGWYLNMRIRSDREALEGAGMDWGIAESLASRIEALIVAESEWRFRRTETPEPRGTWNGLFPEAKEVRKELLEALRYACRHDKGVREQLREVGKGGTKHDFVRALGALAEMAAGHARELESIRFDMGMVDRSRELSRHLSRVLDRAAAGSGTTRREAQDLRNRAYTYLEDAIRAVEGCGRYAFRNDKVKKRTYMHRRTMRIVRKARESSDDVISFLSRGDLQWEPEEIIREATINGHKLTKEDMWWA